MKISLDELHRISKWFDIATQYEDLKDNDLIIHDKIIEYLEEKGVVGEPDDAINYLDEDINADNDDDSTDYDKLDFYEEDGDDENDRNY